VGEKRLAVYSFFLVSSIFLIYAFMDTAELLKKVKKLEIKTKGLSRHLFSGEYHSAFKGRGMSFSEVRSYQYGDDVRNIDWNVTARTGDAYVKVFEEERELTVMLLIDISASSFFGTAKQLKSEFITEICAVLAFSALNNNDKVGILFFTDKIEAFFPPKKGKQHILRIIRELVNVEPNKQGTNVGVALEYLSNVLKKRSIVFVMSDFRSPRFEAELRIAARRHDVIGLHIYDPREAELPNVGLVRVADAETSKTTWLDTSDDIVRRSYAENFQKNSKQIISDFLRYGGDSISIPTTESYIHALMRFFEARK
jgi:uncharacterized protein (DUF58 family)